jgi:hypothetical protein
MLTSVVRLALVLALASCSPARVPPPEPGIANDSDGSASASAGTRPAAAPAYRYTIRSDAELRALEVEVCFDGAVPERLSPPTTEARPLLSGATHAGRALAVDERGIDLGGVPPRACPRYRVDLENAYGKGGAWDGASRVGRDALVSPDLWLWPPEPRVPGAIHRARFELGELGVAVAWPRDDRAASFPYLIPESTFVWKSQAALGRMARRDIALPGGNIDVALLGAGFDDDAAIVAWLRRSAEAVAELLGGFPEERALVLLVPRAPTGGSFGVAVRGGGSVATLFVPRDSRGARLDKDWTAVHELLHFSLPPIVSEDAWLFEGVATYLTALARARAGIIHEREAWWELLDGLARGRASGTGLVLREESRRMHENRAFWRVYWAGAAMALEIDVALRLEGGALTETVAALARSRPDPNRLWHASDVVTELDRLTKGHIPSRVVARHLDSADFPDTAELLHHLGVALDGQRVVFDDSAPGADIRRAIAGPTSRAKIAPGRLEARDAGALGHP